MGHGVPYREIPFLDVRLPELSYNTVGQVEEISSIRSSFLQNSYLWQTDRQTDRHRPIASNALVYGILRAKHQLSAGCIKQLKEGRISLYYDIILQWMIFANFATSWWRKMIISYILQCKVSYCECDRLGRCFCFVCIYACTSTVVFFCCWRFSANKDLYKKNDAGLQADVLPDESARRGDSHDIRGRRRSVRRPQDWVVRMAGVEAQ